KGRPFFPLQFLKRRDYRHDFVGTCVGFRPIGEETIPKIFVNGAVVILDDLLARKNPSAEEKVQVLAPHFSAERGEPANVSDEKPARNSLDLAKCPLYHIRFVLL